MSIAEQHIVTDDVATLLDRLAAAESVQSNCMFQLALMLARIAAEPCPDVYKEEAAQALMGVIRDKPKSNVVRLFGASTSVPASMAPAGGPPTVVQFAAR